MYSILYILFTSNIYNFSMDAQKFVYSMYIIFQRMYTIMYT